VVLVEELASRLDCLRAHKREGVLSRNWRGLMPRGDPIPEGRFALKRWAATSTRSPVLMPPRTTPRDAFGLDLLVLNRVCCNDTGTATPLEPNALDITAVGLYTPVPGTMNSVPKRTWVFKISRQPTSRAERVPPTTRTQERASRRGVTTGTLGCAPTRKPTREGCAVQCASSGDGLGMENA